MCRKDDLRRVFAAQCLFCSWGGLKKKKKKLIIALQRVLKTRLQLFLDFSVSLFFSFELRKVEQLTCIGRKKKKKMTCEREMAEG